MRPRRMLFALTSLAVATAACAPAASPAAPTPAIGRALNSASLDAAASPSPSPAAAYDWKQLFPVRAPMPRDLAVTAYDAADSTVVVSAGQSSCGPLAETYTDTWTWNGLTWTLAATTGAPPVFGVPFAYDAGTGTLVVIWFPSCADGLSTDQWNGSSWGSGASGQSPNQTGGFPNDSGAMAYDPVSQSLLLWSPDPGFPQGFDLGAPTPSASPSSVSPSTVESSTWSWDGSAWTPLSPSTSPSPSVGGTQDVEMVYDAASQQMLLYGEQSQTMWDWDGTDWSELPLTTGPSARVGASLAYDAALGEVVLFGGATVTGYRPPASGQGESYTLDTPLNDFWAWNGSNWTQLQPVTSPPARFYAQMAYDDATGQLVLFGGAVNDIADIADTWVYAPG